MPLVSFSPKGTQFNVKTGGSLLRAARRARLPIASSCRGEGVCLACRVQILEGAENLSEPGDWELLVMKRGKFESGERLACLANVFGPVTITTTYW